MPKREWQGLVGPFRARLILPKQFLGTSRAGKRSSLRSSSVGRLLVCNAAILLTDLAMQPFTSQPAQSFVFWLKAHNKKGQKPVYTVAQIVCLRPKCGGHGSLTGLAAFRTSIPPLGMRLPQCTALWRSGCPTDRSKVDVILPSYSQTWSQSSFSPCLS